MLSSPTQWKMRILLEYYAFLHLQGSLGCYISDSENKSDLKGHQPWVPMLGHVPWQAQGPTIEEMKLPSIPVSCFVEKPSAT